MLPVPDEAIRIFWAGLPAEERPASLDVIVDTARRVWERARTAHPTFSVSPTEFARFFNTQLLEVDSLAELERRHIEDVYVALGCAKGDGKALMYFEHEIVPSVFRALHRAAPDEDSRREVLQKLRDDMLVAHDGPAGISVYDGRAPLVVWLRVCATRIRMRQAGRDQRMNSAGDEELQDLAPGVPDPELTYLQQLYGAEFRTAFADAVASLSPRERNLLRHSVIDGLGIDQIAAIYHIHRATVARQLKQTRARLNAATRERMRNSLGLEDAELNSIFRLIVSMCDITLVELLKNARK